MCVLVFVVLMAAVGDEVCANTEERQLVDERREADISRQVDTTSPVVVQDVAEQFRVAVEEVLASVGVAEVFSLLGPEQRVWKALDCLQPGLVVSTANVQR